MILQFPRIALLIGSLALATQATAGGYHHGHSSGYYGAGPLLGAAVVGAVVGAAVTYNRPVYQPVYVQQPVYVSPPVYVAPPPGYYYQPYPPPPPPPGYYRERYYTPVYYGPPRW
ncbi:hypothetical protein D3C76_421050 [compost metagenome]